MNTAPPPVHNHGPHDGPGLDCPETRRVNGTLRGACMVKHPPLGSEQYDEQFPERVAVWRGDFSSLWWVERTSPHLCTHRPTHAEAIAYAQKIARQA